MRVVLIAALAATLVACGSSQKALPPLRVVGLGVYDFEHDLSPASVGSNRLPRPFASRAELASRAPIAKLVHCAPGICFNGEGWYAFMRGPELTGTNVIASSLRTITDPNTGASVVVMQFTSQGRRRFRSLTAIEARRGRRSPSAPQHFAVVVHGKIVLLPYIDPGKFPAGIPADNGVEIELASRAGAKRLVRELRSR